MNSWNCSQLFFNSSQYCPQKFDCPTDQHWRSLPLHVTPSYFSLVSCSLSVLGSLLIVFTYWKWKDIRTGSRSIVTFLAIADFFTAAGYIVGTSNYIHIIFYGDHLDDSYECVKFNNICEMQSFITTWSSMSSFAWTSYLAMYLYLTIVHGRFSLANRLIPFVHIIAWLLPFLISYVLLVEGALGWSRVAQSNWCFIGLHTHTGPRRKQQMLTILLAFAGGKFWEILTYVLVCVLYIMIKWRIRKEKKRKAFGDGAMPIVLTLDRKMTMIPVLFILLRMWGTLQYLVVAAETWLDHIRCGCTTHSTYWALYVLGYVQAVGDGGQGWGNALLYIFLSPKLRGRLFGCLYRPLAHCCQMMTSKRYSNTDGSINRTAKTPHARSQLWKTNDIEQPNYLAVSVESNSAYFVPRASRRNGPPGEEVACEPTTEFSSSRS